MAFDENDMLKIMRWTALIMQGMAELQNMVKNKQLQQGKSELEIAEHAEQANKEARELFNAL